MREIPEDSFESQIRRAEASLDLIESKEIKAWLTCILEILKKGKYARVQMLTGKCVDVSKIAFTIAFASFFDVYNHIEMFNISIQPIMVEELKYTLSIYKD